MAVFTVEATGLEGYRATNATSGTRLNTAIIDVPMSLEVVTAEFIEDTGATDLRESLAYSAGISFDSFAQGGGSSGPGANTATFQESSPSAGAAIGDRTTNAVSIRGFAAPFQQRMGFRVGATVPNYGVTLGALVDTVNVERNEILRGPGALLYGIGVISGIINVIPQRPVGEFFTRTSFGIGSEDYLRATVDHTGPVFARDAHRLNYRVAAAYTEDGDWTDHFLETREYATAQLEYQFASKARLLLEYQNGVTEFRGIGQPAIYDDLSGANNNEYRNEFFESYNWGEFYGGLSASSRITGPDTKYTRDEETFLANIEFTPLRNLTFNIGYFGSTQETERFTINVSQINNGEARISVLGDLDPDQYFVVENPPDPFTGADRNDYKAIRYWWTNRPQAVDSSQVRTEFNYTLRTPGFGNAEDIHNFLGGMHYIRDEIDFYRGNEGSGQVIDESRFESGNVNDDGDAYFVRDFYDFSDFRYNGEPLAQPGRDYLTSTLWYRGYYAVYHGRFWDERLGAIAGYRRDSFQAYEELWAREQFDPTNRRIGTEFEGYNFEDDVIVESATFALNYKFGGGLSVYGLRAEGVSPNTGQQDGSGNFFEPERTTSTEVGIKLSAFNGRISGTVSFFKIERENATFFWARAPSPALWGDHDGPFANTANFRPDLIESGEVRQGYAIDISYFDVEEDLGWANGRRPRGNWWENVPGVIGENRNVTFGTGTDPQDFIILDYQMLDEAGFRDEMDLAFAESRFRARPDDINPIYYTARDRNENLVNGSAFPGATVSFTDEATGFDFQLIMEPLENWQIVASYAQVEREAISGFLLSDARALSSGIAYGTEYDVWIRDLGVENFEDPTDPSTATGGGVKGLNLSYQPEKTGSLWSNYKFAEGALEGFEFGLGLIYVGSAQTSVPIGGANLVSNLYGTPDSEAYYEINGAVTYKRAFDSFDLRVSLNFYNLLNDTYHESRVTYENVVTGEDEKRRYFFYRDPRSFRLTTTFAF